MIDLHFCEYNRSNQDYDTIFRPSGSGDYLLLLLKTPMKVYLRRALPSPARTPASFIRRASPSTIRRSAASATVIFTFLPEKIPRSGSVFRKTGFSIRRIPRNSTSISAVCSRSFSPLLPTGKRSSTAWLRNCSSRSPEAFPTLQPKRKKWRPCIRPFRSSGWKCSPTAGRTGVWNASAKASAWKKASFTPITTVSFLPLPKAICFRFDWKKQKTC